MSTRHYRIIGSGAGVAGRKIEQVTALWFLGWSDVSTGIRPPSAGPHQVTLLHVTPPPHDIYFTAASNEAAASIAAERAADAVARAVRGEYGAEIAAAYAPPAPRPGTTWNLYRRRA